MSFNQIFPSQNPSIKSRNHHVLNPEKMVSNISRLILMKSAASPRLFSTATKGKRASLFQKLSDLETTEGDVAEALDQWVAEVKSSNVLNCVNRLLKDEKYKRAAQVFICTLLVLGLFGFREN